MPSSLGRTLLIANPAAQRGNGAKAAQIARDLLEGWTGEGALEFAATARAKHAIEIAETASTERFDTVIALGGDGVVHEVVNGLMRVPADLRPRFGLIPVGSGNDYARTLRMSESVPDAVAQFIDAREEAFDVGCCNGEFFAETLSFGLDAAIALDTVQRRERTGEQGTVLYLKSGLDQLLHHLDAYDFSAELFGGGANAMASAGENAGAFGEGNAKELAGGNADILGETTAKPLADVDADVLGETSARESARKLAGSVHMLAVQVGPTYGGGFRICPDADPSDGLLDICYADAPMGVIQATFKFLSAKDAHHTKFKNIHFERAARIELSFDRRPPCQIDGEPHIADAYSISVEPRALRVLRAPA